MGLSTVEQSMADLIEQTGDMIGEYLLQRPNFGAEVLEVLQPSIRDMALAYADVANATAVMADATQPIALEP